MIRPDPIEKFQKHAIDRLAKRPLPPADNAEIPALAVCLGPPIPEALTSLRNMLPPSTCLLWIFAPADQSSETMEQTAADASFFTMACPADNSRDFLYKTAFLTTLLADRRVRLLKHELLHSGYSAITNSLDRAIKNAIENINQDELRGLIRLRSSIRNIPSIWRNTGIRLTNLPPKTPAIICGAGPSLSAQLEEIRELRERAILIAVGHAIPAMLNEGVQPDLAVADDARAWWDMPESLNPDIPLVASAELTSAIADRFKRVLWCRGSSLPFSIVLNALGINLHNAELRKTVSIHAIDVAIRLGCDRICLVGQDLCLADDGALHAGGAKPIAADELFEIPGNEGRHVRANNDLLSLRDAIEEYVNELSQNFANKPLIANCTLGGALIRGVERLPLKAFLADSPVIASKPALFEENQSTPPSADWLDKLGAEIDAFQTNALAAIDSARMLKRELARYPLRPQVVRKTQQTLNDAVRKEKEISSASVSGHWQALLSRNTDRLCQETPGLMSDSTEPNVQLDFLQTRFKLLADIAADALDTLKSATQQVKGAKPATAPIPSPVVFNSFRSFNLQRMRAGNPKLAEAMANRNQWPLPDRFAIRLVNQAHQHVSVRLADGAWHPCSSLFSMIEDARADTERAAANWNFNPERHALTIVAPGNYLHAVTFAERFNNLDLALLDPWPELFSHLMDFGAFLHKLPPSALILCADDRFPEWHKLYSERMEQRRRANRQTFVFTPPLMSGMSETQTIISKIITKS